VLKYSLVAFLNATRHLIGKSPVGLFFQYEIPAKSRKRFRTFLRKLERHKIYSQLKILNNWYHSAISVLIV